MSNLKSYQEFVVDQETGEELIANKYLYMPGRPREYRFNGQNGQFNLYGERVLMDEKGKTLTSFSFQPVSFRIFDAMLFGRTNIESWAELFFIDKEGCVSAIMFNNTTVVELFRLMEPLHYEKLSLCDVVITARPERVTSKNDPTKTWFICRFSYEIGPLSITKELKEYAKDVPIYRAETITPHSTIKIMSKPFERVLDNEAYQLYNGIVKPDDVIPVAQLAATNE